MRSLMILAASVAMIGLAAPSYAGKVIPDFKLDDLNGESVSFYNVLASGPGPTVLSFWYVACEPCKDEHVELQELLDEYEDDGLVVVAVSVDSSKTVSGVKPYVRGNGYTFTVLLDIDGNVKQTLGVPYEPYTFLVDCDGNVIHEKLGYRKGDEKVLEEAIVAYFEAGEPETLILESVPMESAPSD
ncbi:MAG: TlpA family protein disulfide reductase [Candidatus Coatesbacteria bacterium]|nr:MAG: TlpA family protein disulfide reductase [Candidatus Coatesbacteria bacterium]